MTTAACNHLDPHTFIESRAADGRIRMTCRGCRKFMGYKSPETKQRERKLENT